MIRLVWCCLFFCLYGCDSRSELDRFADKTTIEAVKKIENPDFYSIGMGGGCTIEKKINSIIIRFVYKKPLTINSARSLMIKSALSIMSTFNSNPNSPRFFETLPLSVNLLDIIISSNKELSENNEIVTAFLLDGQIRYCIPNPSTERPHSPLLTVHTESYEEAKAIVEQQKQ